MSLMRLWSSYPRLLGIMLAGLLIGCQSGWSQPELVLGEAATVNLHYRKALEPAPVYIRTMRCAGVKLIKTQLVIVRAGKAETVWSGKHKRTSGSEPSSTCVLMVSLEPETGTATTIPAVGFGFGGEYTSGSGSGKAISLPNRFLTGNFVIQEAPDNLSVLPGKPVAIYMRASGNEPTLSNFPTITSVEQAISISSQAKDLILLIVTLAR